MPIWERACPRARPPLGLHSTTAPQGGLVVRRQGVATLEAAGLEDTRHWLRACIAARSSPLPPCPCPCPWECRECRAARRARGVRRHRGGRARALLNGRLTMLPRPSALTRPAPGSKVRCLGCTRRVPWRSGTTWVGEVQHTAAAHGICSVRALLSGACGATQHPERLSAELWQEVASNKRNNQPAG